METTKNSIKKAIATIKEAIENRTEQLFKNISTEIDIRYYFDDDMESYDELYEAIEDGGGFNVEIIYYSNAMEYLMENDNSLNESMAIANELGYTPDNINSELLASLLASQNAREEFGGLESEFEDYFESKAEAKEAIERLEEMLEELDEDNIEEITEELDEIINDYKN